MLGEGKTFMLFLGRVGKTSLTLRFCMDQFDDKQESTINATYLEKQLSVGNDNNATLAIWVSQLKHGRIQLDRKSFMQ